MAKWVAYYSILMGVLQIGTWVVLYFLGMVKNYYVEKPFETVLLLIAEFLTAIAMIIGGSGVLTEQRWGVPANLAALGMMLYCAIFSFGSFGQTGNVPAAAWFAILTLTALAAIVGLLIPFSKLQPV